jgi:hypothetical protein
LAAVQAELQRYKPGQRSEVVELEAYIARRVKLWARLDALLGIKKPAIARPVAG